MSEVDDNDIAIVGMALRVARAGTPEQYWDNLCRGIDGVRSYTDEELLAKGVSKRTLEDPSYVRAGIPLENLEQFDPEFFGFSPKEAAILDPQHRHFYEVSWEALERSGHPPRSFDGAVGVFAGCGMGAYLTFNVLTNPDLVDSVGLFLLRHTGNDKDFLATRVSYAFDLKGPSVNVQTACSTSLVATHMAVQSLLSGECDLALAGGSTIEVPHGTGYHYKEGEVLSPDGRCRAFDHKARGTVFGSGAGVVVLRRLADAIEDGDHIHAVIKGSAINNDGAAKVGYLAPSVDGQAAAIAEALAVADITADSISYVECHGTGTAVGDPIEVSALTKAFRETSSATGHCRLGSVKTNIGHLDTAAGVASLIKAALVVEHGRIPPTLNFEAANPAIEFDGSPFLVADTLADWPQTSQPRRAGVNSLGVGGTNAFVILEQPPRVETATVSADDPHFIMLSGRSRKALDQNAERLTEWMRANPDQRLGDVAFTLCEGRERFEHRRVLACRSLAEAADLLEQADPRRVFNQTIELQDPEVVFMFPGGGAQYFQMGQGLYRSEPVFREHVDRGIELLKRQHHVDVEGLFHAGDDAREWVTAELDKPSLQLPLTFVIEYALTQMWAAYGLIPDAVIGHSMGENTAACVAGVLSFEETLGLLRLRGHLVEQAPPGGVLSVPMPAAELAELIGSDLDIAGSNSPQLTTVSGPGDALDALGRQLAAQGIDSQRVKVGVAAHSRLFDGILPAFREHLETLNWQSPTMPIISNRTGDWHDQSDLCDPEYWVSHLRHTVQFSEGVATLLDGRDRVFLEVGPGNTLGSFVRQQPGATAQTVVSSMRHANDQTPDDVYLQSVIGRLLALGIDLDVERLFPPDRRRVPLPTYAFQHAPYWIEPGSGSMRPETNDDRPARLENVGRWFQAPKWIQQGLLDQDSEPHTWLVFQDGDPVLEALCAKLRIAGNTVVTVRSGDIFARIDQHRYTLAPEAGGEAYAELFESLEQDGLLPDRLLHGWLLTRDETFRPGSSFFHRNQNLGFYSLFHIARALARRDDADGSRHLLVLANGAQSVADEPLPYPDKATALGPCAVVPRELPGVTCRFVDIELSGAVKQKRRNGERAPETRVEALLEEALAPPSNGVVAWRGDVRWQRHVAAARQASANDRERSIRLETGGVYVLTGGFGGIAGVIADWLAREYRARLVLVGRTPVPDRDSWDRWIDEHGEADQISRAISRVRALEAAGAEVLALSADVTVAEQMDEVVRTVRASFGAVNGVFHTAGTIRDSLIQMKSPREIEDVFSAKVYGTVVVEQAFRQEALDFLMLFASTSAYVAPQGQIDYVGANSFVNAYALARRGDRRYPVVAVNWGIWRDVGLVAPARHSSSVFELAERGDSQSCEFPLFGNHVAAREGTRELHHFFGTLDSANDWIIDDHRLKTGDGLLPGTGYLELIRAALAELGDEGPWEIQNLVFQSPLFVPDAGRRDFCVTLRGNDSRWAVEVLAAPVHEDDDAVTCISARVMPVSTPERPRVDFGAAEAETAVGESAAGSSALKTRQEEHLNFGPRWQVLRRYRRGQAHAVGHLQLAPALAADVDVYRLHAGLIDIATGFAMDLIPGYAEQEVAENLWVPLSYEAFRYFSPLDASITSLVRIRPESSVASGFASFDITLCDADGRVLAEVDGLTLRKMESRFAAPEAAAADADRQKSKAASPGEAALQYNLSQGIDSSGGLEALARLLAGPALPSEIIISSMVVPELVRQAERVAEQSQTAAGGTRFDRPELDSDFEEPRDDVERTLADLWGKLLGVDGIGIHDSFFDLGGHSLIAVRLFSEIADRFGADLPMSVLMQSPTIGALAETIRGGPAGEVQGADAEAETAPALRFRHIVPMHDGPVSGGTPLFIVAGMFGNVLNLGHLAHLLGEDRPVYALQARGLYGDTEPHETFEEMARDYIEEMRQVQPDGPYLLGGFSGGGLIAYEMARQLLALGQEVQRVVMLDTPVREFPRFTLADKVSMIAQGIRSKGLGHVLDKVKTRVRWEMERRERAQQAEPDDLSFQSRKIGEAFIRALTRYEVPSVPVAVAVFRPKLNVVYRLSGGRQVDAERNYVRADNGWSPYVEDLTVVEVPGNHDSMVLEPNVRVLVAEIRRAIADQVPAGVPATAEPPAELSSNAA